METINHIFGNWNFSGLSAEYGYLGIFLFFVTVDQMTPIPEEVTLLTIGYLSSRQVFHPFWAGLVSLAAFVLIDMAYFFLARSGNKFMSRLFNRRGHTFTQRYQLRLKEHFGLTLFILCFIPRMRVLGPLLSGMMAVSYKKFLLYDTIGLVVFTALYIFLGMAFHGSLEHFLGKFQAAQHLVFTGVMVVIAVVIFFTFHKTTADESN